MQPSQLECIDLDMIRELEQPQEIDEALKETIRRAKERAGRELAEENLTN